MSDVIRPYDIKLTIKGLRGPWAEKYSHQVQNAQNLDALVRSHKLRTRPIGRGEPRPIELFAPSAEPVHVDAMPYFPAMMKLLQKVALAGDEQHFRTGVRTNNGPWRHQVEVRDAAGAPVVVHGLGPDTDLPELADSTQLELRREPLGALFRADLERIIEMIEEAMAKDDLIVTTLPGESLA